MTGEQKRELHERLNRLPEEKGFDRQFQAIPDAIKEKAIRTYKINTGIMLKISDIGNENDISAYEDAYGKKYLKIRLSDDRTLQKCGTRKRRKRHSTRHSTLQILKCIAGIITECRIAYPPFEESLKAIFEKKAQAQAK